MIESFERRENDLQSRSAPFDFPPPSTVNDSYNVAELCREVEGLRHALESRPLIEQAKGILMCRYGVDGPRAFSILKRWSMDSNIKVRDIAGALVEFSAAGKGGPRTERTPRGGEAATDEFEPPDFFAVDATREEE